MEATTWSGAVMFPLPPRAATNSPAKPSSPSSRPTRAQTSPTERSTPSRFAPSTTRATVPPPTPPPPSCSPSPPPPSQPPSATSKSPLNWTKNTADAAVSAWQYRYKPKSSTDTGYTNWTNVPGSSISTTSYVVTGLTNDTQYTFQLRGVNATGSGPASSEATATPAIQPPAKPTGLAATVGDTKITLAWTNPNNHRITKWQYSYKPKSSTETGYTDWKDVLSSGASTTTYTVTGLTNETEYTFRVRAYTTSEGTQSDSVKATPKPVAATPANFAATVDSNVASAAVKLTWDAQSTATDWEIRHKSTGGYGSWTNICDSDCTSGELAAHTVTGLTNNTLYTFQLRARKQHRLGPPRHRRRPPPLRRPRRGPPA